MSLRNADLTRFDKGSPDPAAIFGLAYSLHEACIDPNLNEGANVGEVYDGHDQFMREIMRVAHEFESWSRAHIDFERLKDDWPCLMRDKFGRECVAVVSAVGLTDFDSGDCLQVALRLRIPVRFDDKLPIPICLECPNPVEGAGFRALRIQTVRDAVDGESVTVFSAGDAPFDPKFGAPYFGLYGVGGDDLLEHIADRGTYSEAATLARAIAPSIGFPEIPCAGR